MALPHARCGRRRGVEGDVHLRVEVRYALQRPLATVVIGAQSVIAGILGMNFKAPLFESGATGFWGSLVAMGVFAVVALVVARLKKWM